MIEVTRVKINSCQIRFDPDNHPAFQISLGMNINRFEKLGSPIIQ